MRAIHLQVWHVSKMRGCYGSCVLESRLFGQILQTHHAIGVACERSDCGANGLVNQQATVKTGDGVVDSLVPNKEVA